MVLGVDLLYGLKVVEKVVRIVITLKLGVTIGII
jgi:hypothetical protein